MLEQVIAALADASNQTNNEVRKQGEDTLKGLGSQAGFLSTLLDIYQRTDVDEASRLLAVIYLKNSIDKSWRKSVSSNLLPEEKQHIRSQLLHISELPISPRLHRQFAAVVAKVAKHDFPRSWPDIFDDIRARVSRLLSENNLASFANLLVTVHQVTKAIAPTRIGPARGQFNDISPDLINVFSVTYNTIMNNAGSSSEGITAAYTALKIVGTLLYDGDDRMHRHAQAQEFFRTSLDTLHSLVKVWIDHGSEALGKHVSRFGKIYLRLSEKRPVSFILLSRSFEVLEFYRHLILDKGEQFYSNGTKEDRQEFVDKIIIQGMLLHRNILKVIQKNPKTMSAALLPVNMRPRDDNDKQDLSTAYDQSYHYYAQDQRTSDIIRVILEHFFILRSSDLELWSTDAEEFIGEDLLATYEYKVNITAQVLFDQLLKSFPDLGSQVIQFVETTVNKDSQDLGDILQLDSALQALQCGTQAFNSIFQIEPMVVGILVPRIMAHQEDAYRIIRRRVCLVLADWLPSQASDQLAAVVYQLAVSVLFTKDSLNDLPVQLAALQAIKVTVDDVDFTVEVFLPFAEATFQKIYDLINNEVDSLDIKRYILEVLSVLVEQLGPQLSPQHIETILSVLPPLWEEKTDNQLIKTVILQTLMHLVDAAKEKSPVCYPLAIQALDVSVEPSSPLFSYLFEDALGLWKSLVVNAPAANQDVLKLFPHLVTLLTAATEHISEELNILESYLRLEPGITADEDTATKLFSLFAVYLPEASVEVSLSILQNIELMAASQLPSAYVNSLQKSGLINILVDYALPMQGPEAEIILGIRATKVYGIFSWIGFLDPTVLRNLVASSSRPDALQIVAAWIPKVNSVADPRERKMQALGVSSLLRVEPTLFLELSRHFIDLWSLILDEVVETNGDAEIYHASELYPGETDDDLTPEQHRVNARRKGEPSHTVDLQQWLGELVKTLSALPDHRYTQALNGWVPPGYSH